MFYDNARYDRAEVFFEEAVTVYSEVFGANHKKTVQQLHLLGCAHQRLGRHAQADAAFEGCRRRAALAAIEEGGGGGSGKGGARDIAAIAHVLLSVAESSYHACRYDDVVEQCKEIVSAKNKHHGEKNHRSTAEVKALQAAALAALGKLSEAEATSSNAYMIAVKGFKPEAKEMGDAFYARGALLLRTGDIAAGVAMLREALTARRKLLAAVPGQQRHPQLSDPLFQLGVAWLEHGSWPYRALRELAKARALRLEYFRPDHAAVVDADYHHAWALLQAGHHLRALGAHLRVLRLRLGVDEDAPVVADAVPVRDDVGDSLTAVGACYLRLGQLDAAERHLTEAVRVLRELFGEKAPREHPKALDALCWLVEVRRLRGAFSAALPVMDDVANGRRFVYSYNKTHPRLLQSTRVQAELARDHGDVGKALSLIRILIEQHKKLQLATGDRAPVDTLTSAHAWRVPAAGAVAAAVPEDAATGSVSQTASDASLEGMTKSQKDMAAVVALSNNRSSKLAALGDEGADEGHGGSGYGDGEEDGDAVGEGRVADAVMVATEKDERKDRDRDGDGADGESGVGGPTDLACGALGNGRGGVVPRSGASPAGGSGGGGGGSGINNAAAAAVVAAPGREGNGLAAAAVAVEGPLPKLVAPQVRHAPPSFRSLYLCLWQCPALTILPRSRSSLLPTPT